MRAERPPPEPRPAEGHSPGFDPPHHYAKIAGMELPDLAGRGEVVRRYAHLLHHFGKELGRRPLVLQNAQFFPDVFAPDEPSLVRLVRRLQVHAGMSDIPIAVRLLSSEGALEAGGGSCKTSGCGTGACAPAPADGELARLVEGPEGWTLNVLEAELHHAVSLTTHLSRALAQVFLAETQSETAPVEAPVEASVDLTSVALGFGLLALEGSYIYAKSCGGPSVTTLTALSVGEVAVATSLFISVGNHSARRALSNLGTTQRALLSEANDWAASNSKIVDQLVKNPGALSQRAPELSDTKPALLRWFDRPSRPKELTLEEALSSNLSDTELLALARSVDPKRPVRGT